MFHIWLYFHLFKGELPFIIIKENSLRFQYSYPRGLLVVLTWWSEMVSRHVIKSSGGKQYGLFSKRSTSVQIWWLQSTYNRRYKHLSVTWQNNSDIITTWGRVNNESLFLNICIYRPTPPRNLFLNWRY